MRAGIRFIGLYLIMGALLAACVADPSKPGKLDRPGDQTRSTVSIEDRSGETQPRRLFENEEAGLDLDRLSEPVIERGTGRLIGQPEVPATLGVDRNDVGDLTLNVVDADIRDVVRLVLEDGLGANYIIDPAITGTITVRTSRPVPADDVVAMLTSVLSLNGAALVQQGDLYKILPSDQAAIAGGRPGTRTTARAGRPGSGIHVAPIRYADAVQLAELLQPFVANQGALQVDATRNTLLLVGSADQNATMTDLIEMFDVDWMAGMSFGLYPLKSVGPTQLATELDQILGDPETGVAAGALRFVPLDRLNALLAIAVQPGYLDRAESWIKRLDKAGDGEGEQVYVYSVQNGRAADLAAVLGELFDIKSTAVGDSSLLAPGLEPVELRSSLPTFSSEETGVDNRESEIDREEPSRSFRQRQGQGSSGLGDRDLTQGRDNDSTRIVADEANNALLVRSTAKEYRKIQAALRELDKQPLQVLLEATIAEVSLRDELSFGVQWFFGSGGSGVTLSEFNNGAVGQLFPGFSGLLSRGDVRAVINALDDVTDVKVISSPQILVLDNQTAQLEVGDEVPIVTQQAEGIDTGDARIVNTVEQRQTGVILNVTPRVNSSGLVILDIDQEVSDVVLTTTSGIDSPTISQRRIGTSVAVGSDQTVALGGLIQDDLEEIRSGVPLLKDIPIFGWLFGATTTISDRTELLVLITPKVLTNQQEAAAATDELRNRLRALEPLQAKIRNNHTDSSQALEQAFAIQLASLSSEAEAWDAWNAYKEDHPEAFRDLGANVEKVKVEGKATFRLQVGQFKEIGQANQLCSTIKDQGTDCLVVQK